jgi:hypothetical protein
MLMPHTFEPDTAYTVRLVIRRPKFLDAMLIVILVHLSPWSSFVPYCGLAAQDEV